MVADTDICNLALDHIGIDIVDDIATATPPGAVRVRRHYDHVLKVCLRKGNWGFATKRVALAQVLPAPVNEYTYAYNLPADYIKMQRTWPREMDYKIESGRLLTDEGTVTIKYTSDEVLTDPAKMDPLFVDYFSFELALRSMPKASASSDLYAQVRDGRNEAFKNAAAIMSQEDPDEPMIESQWITSRWAPDWDYGSIRINELET